MYRARNVQYDTSPHQLKPSNVLTMVLFLLFIKAELENISYVELRPDANLRIHVKNPLSDYEVREDIIVDASKFVPQEDTTKESPYHFGLRWEGAKKVSTLTVLTAEEVKTALKKKKMFLYRPESTVKVDRSHPSLLWNAEAWNRLLSLPWAKSL